MSLVVASATACAELISTVTTTTTAATTTTTTTDSGFDVIEVETKANQPWLEYSIDLALSSVATTLDNPNDIVTPYIENRFRVRVTDIVQSGTTNLGFKERIDKYVASGDMPDVIIAGSENCAYAVATGLFADLTDEIDKMENLNRTIDPVFWPRFMNDGVKTQIPITGPDVSKEPYAGDPYVAPMSSWGMWIREDILERCGYIFSSLAEIERQYLSRGLLAPTEAYQTNPPIKTPDDFYELLKKIANLRITIDGEPLIPWSSSGWSQLHMGSMFDFGQWRADPLTGEADAFVGSPGAKEYYQFLNRLYQEGLIDPDFMNHSEEQAQSKIASGRVAMGMYIPGVQDAQAALYQSVGEKAVIRYIEWPKQKEGVGAFDIFENGFWRLIIRDGFPDKERLTQYFDWFYSEEGQDILTWGPEDAGVWEYRDGVKRFIDPRVEEDCLLGVTGGRGADYWGLYTITSGSYFPYLSKAGICAPYTTVNYADYRRSFPPKLDSMVMNRAAVSLGGYDRSGRYAYGDGSELVSQVTSYYWSHFVGEEVHALLEAATEAEFNDLWDEAYDRFLEGSDYERARQVMTVWFKTSN
ncbi:MAG: extracellular solute-binding protein [Oscillospiraceae bacterium]|nr:extracellular solute-binding protein [Oscillospiraceae bacterium]